MSGLIFELSLPRPNDKPSGYLLSLTSTNKQLAELLEAYGVAGEYINYAGEMVSLDLENRLKVLTMLEVDVSSDEAVAASLAAVRQQQLLHWLPSASVITADAACDLALHFDHADLPIELRWQIDTEQGEQISGVVLPIELPERTVDRLDHHSISTRALGLPALPPGYHQITLSSMTQQLSATLISAPDTAYQPGWLTQDNKLAGVSVQVYSLNSTSNWGMGDFSDLQDIVVKLASSGVDFVVLNPLHLLDSADPEHCSPYSPMDRRFLNPLYIDPKQVEDYFDNEDLVAYINQEPAVRQLEALRHKQHVDYTAVRKLKIDVLHRMYQHFRRAHLASGSPRAQAFNEFVDRRGEEGKIFANYQVEHNRFRVASADDPMFHLYLQWLAEIQLETCQQLALVNGMAVGLVRDLAVASKSDSAEVKLHSNLFCRAASIGAPPDPLAPQGQNWGLPPMKPTELIRSGYSHFIDLLRSNMSHCGALRIDHIMALMRLWWCPGSGDSSQGAYVHYPVNELFAILRLESARNQCVVIGEDLGVVPPQVRELMASSGVLSNALFYFEKYDAIRFKRPEDFSQKCLAMIANHDVPTLSAWWNKTDIQLRNAIGLIGSEEELNALIHDRESDLIQTLHWLESSGLKPESWWHFNIHEPFDVDLCRAIFQNCGRARSQMVSIQLEDLCLTDLPVNIPGTSDQYPNWRRKIPMNVDELLASESAQAMLADLVAGRRQS